MKAPVDMYLAACVQNADNTLKNRFNAAQDKIESTADVVRRIVGIVFRAADAGYVKFIQGSTVLASFDAAAFNALVNVVDLDIPCPLGDGVAVVFYDTGGTGAASANVMVDETAAA
jgi:hypothetical protein